jgi:hypothetical protein
MFSSTQKRINFGMTTTTAFDPMEKAISLVEAVRCALLTLEEQPAQVPQIPKGWAAKARAALNSKVTEEIKICALEIAKAHSQYRAEFDIKGWLFELRIAIEQSNLEEQKQPQKAQESWH